jgi:two-component system chemotaxis sensor kinase CheA
MDREKKAEAAIKRQISLWDDFIKGEHNLYVFAQKTISFLCRYLRAITGTFYLLFDDEGEKALRIVGTYVANTNRRRGMESSLKENYLLRRVEMEKEVVVILDAPDERLGLITCFGNLLPQNIAIFPIIIDEEVVALLEVGSSKIFSNNDLEFAKRMCTIASSSIRSHNARGQIRNLLEQSKAQTLKLETQRERLKRKPEKA